MIPRAWWWAWLPAESPPVRALNAFTEEIARRDLAGVLVTQTGCIGLCQYEPIVEVTMPGQEKVTYVKMTPDKVGRVVADHIIGGKPVTEFTIGAAAR